MTSANTYPEDKGLIHRHQTLSYKLSAGLAGFILLLLVAALIAIWFQGKPLLVEESLAKNKQIGISIVLALGERMAKIEGITAQIANFAKAAPKDPTLFQKVIPSLLNISGLEHVIAGGGVWPEPYLFDKKMERRSFFWGRNSGGELEYYNDYNIPAGPGYHHTEWYVPARYTTKDEVYWSRSYTDPYSLQTMVTCTAPIYLNDNFIGVSTVDLMLDGLSKILSKLTAQAGGYAFIVDRNNKFIAYPDPNQVITKRGGIPLSDNPNEQGYPDFVTVKEFSEKHPSFTPVANFLTQLDTGYSNKNRINRNLLLKQAQLIDQESDEITSSESQLISSQLLRRLQKKSQISSIGLLRLSDDLILDGPTNVEVFSMPMTSWKVITVFPTDTITRQATKISINLSLMVVLFLCLFSIAASFLLRRLTRRLTTITGDIRLATENTENQKSRLNDDIHDEIGVLSYWFNRRTEQLIEAKTNAEYASQAKSKFLASMSHELRTPMNAIMGFTKHAIKKLDGKIDDKPMEALRTVDQNAEHLLNLINGILDVAKIEENGIELATSTFFINPMLYDLHAQFSSIAHRQHLSFNLIPLDHDIEFVGDINKIKRILSNILSNAFKSTKKGGVSIKPEIIDHHRFQIAIIDTGTGLSQSDVEKLFQRFAQVKDGIGAESGTGLGLYLSQRFAHEHDGNITVESEVGIGSIFSLTLPYEN
ncbi:hypothetical protein A9Q99_05900 [Gammaproteobacteria bacterium 45_16_T64]|nr:hypothetical protein A9Q99_05900 [Gammaproteobacteria bacterium 45_16_T64]